MKLKTNIGPTLKSGDNSYPFLQSERRVLC